MKLVQIAENIWALERELMMPGRIRLNGRMTIIRLLNGDLILHSPVLFDDSVASEIDRFGPVRHLIAPNKFHHLQYPAAAARYPVARRYCAPGLMEKRPDIGFHETLSNEAPSAWRDELQQIFIEGVPAANEVVFVHLKSKTLIVADLVFNIQNPRGLGITLFMKMVGAFKRLAPSRVWKFLVKDKAKFERSIQSVLACDFDRIVPGHGEVFETGARSAFRVALVSRFNLDSAGLKG